MTNSLAARLEQNAERFPDKPVFIHPGRGQIWQRVTYRQLSERSQLLARGLSAYDIRPSTRAVVMIPPSVDFFALMFALLQVGIVPIMVDPAIGLHSVTVCLTEAKPEVYFGSVLSHGIRHLFGWGRNSLRLNLKISDLARAGASVCMFQPAEIEPESDAAIIYTSGSTGLPKGAVYTYANFAAQIEMLVHALQLRGDEIDLPAFPLFAIIDCLLGVTAVIPDMRFPPPAKVDPARMMTAIEIHQVDSMFVSPAALERVVHYGVEKNLRLPGLKRVVTAGAPAPFEVLEQCASLLSPDAELIGIYGATETLPVSIINSREILQETRYRSAQGAGICIGRPVNRSHVQIIPISDEVLTYPEASPLPPNQIGEIAVSGVAVTKRYIGREQSNRLAKIVDADETIIHRMGDVGYFDEEGRLWYCGRKSHRVVTGSDTLFTESIEGIFNAHPLVYRTALVGVEKAGRTEPVLWVQLKRNVRGVDQYRIRTELLELAKVHEAASLIKRILFHASFPTDVRHNSKIIREKLAEWAKTKS